MESCVLGFHMEVLICTSERRNNVDQYAVSILKDDSVHVVWTLANKNL